MDIRQFSCNVRCSQNCAGEGTEQSIKCLECDSSEQFIQNSECVESLECENVAVYKADSGTINICASDCPINYQPDIYKICKLCHQSCKPGKCFNGEDEFSCSECIQGKVLFNGTCKLESCPEFYYNNNSICYPCHENCATCSGSLNTQCLSCFPEFELKNLAGVRECIEKNKCSQDEFFLEKLNQCVNNCQNFEEGIFGDLNTLECKECTKCDFCLSNKDSPCIFFDFIVKQIDLSQIMIQINQNTLNVQYEEVFNNILNSLLAYCDFEISMIEPYEERIFPNISEIQNSVFYFNLYPVASEVKTNITCNLTLKRKNQQNNFTSKLTDLELVKYFAPMK
eukprot:TRINITY_DN2544_c0_g1_i2.p1 TRINITY_DN2544_c0_g1~~TRINITY_DN2544_c0_g1_i2.p1  ORF type:complete len:340 (-),score=65.23 TRINITY_DN2544_c0_g1_i2:920-1939(-)